MECSNCHGVCDSQLDFDCHMRCLIDWRPRDSARREEFHWKLKECGWHFAVSNHNDKHLIVCRKTIQNKVNKVFVSDMISDGNRVFICNQESLEVMGNCGVTFACGMIIGEAQILLGNCLLQKIVFSKCSTSFGRWYSQVQEEPLLRNRVAVKQ